MLKIKKHWAPLFAVFASVSLSAFMSVSNSAEAKKPGVQKSFASTAFLPEDQLQEIAVRYSRARSHYLAVKDRLQEQGGSENFLQHYHALNGFEDWYNLPPMFPHLRFTGTHNMSEAGTPIAYIDKSQSVHIPQEQGWQGYRVTTSDSEAPIIYTEGLGACINVLMVSKTGRSITKAVGVHADRYENVLLLENMAEEFDDQEGVEIYLWGGDEHTAGVMTVLLFEKIQELIEKGHDIRVVSTDIGPKPHTHSIAFDTRSRQFIPNVRAVKKPTLIASSEGPKNQA